MGYPAVLKADGLAGGKGVLIAESREESDRALALFFDERVFGSAGDRVLVEEFLTGSEVTFLAVCDGQTAVPLPTSRDYKKVYDGDRGPNTGGMGAHSPSGNLDAAASSEVFKEIIRPAVAGLASEGRPFRGVLYAGLMITESGPKVLEFNARFGDPEAEVVLPRLQSDLAALLVAAGRGELERHPPLDVKPEACVGVVCLLGRLSRTLRDGQADLGLGRSGAHSVRGGVPRGDRSRRRPAGDRGWARLRRHGHRADHGGSRRTRLRGRRGDPVRRQAHAAGHRRSDRRP